MTAHPDLSHVLEAGEALLWQGRPKAGRPAPARGTLLGVAFFLAATGLVVLAWWIEIFGGQHPQARLGAYFVVASAAFCSYLGLRVTVLDRRRARARDARTIYAITDRRALALAGPYGAALDIGPEIEAEVAGDTLTIAGPGGALRFERLDDAAKARDILCARIGGTA